jgi:GDP-fucose transporter C1
VFVSCTDLLLSVGKVRAMLHKECKKSSRRSLTVVLTFSFSVLYTREKYSASAIVGCVLVVIGFVAAVYDPRETCSINGFLLGTFGAVFVVAYSFLAQGLSRLMPTGDVMFYTNVLVAILLALPALASIEDALPLTSVNTLALLLCSCVASVAVNWATLNQIKRTSPLTHTLSTTCKAVVQTAVDAVLRSISLAPMFVLASALVFAGSFTYATASAKRVFAIRRVGEVLIE